MFEVLMCSCDVPNPMRDLAGIDAIAALELEESLESSGRERKVRSASEVPLYIHQSP